MRPLSVLLTQCLQRDFVDPLRPHDELPNALHVGHAESRRLLGDDPEHGPVARLMEWARAQPPEDLAILHIRDWHDPKDAHQADHLAAFGSHCVAGTRGAQLVLGLDAGRGPAEHIVDATGLNDFEGTTLPALLGKLIATGRPLRVGVVGVWTEAKVGFLLYDLKTRLGLDTLATCSALCASSNRQQHFLALDHLRRILGVTVFDGVADFTRWLAPESPLELPSAPARLGAEITCAAPLDDADRAVLSHLFRGSAAVSLTTLAGGFSGARVFAARSRDALGREQAQSVVKVGPPALIGKERAAFEQVEEVLGNSAPSLRGFVDGGARAGLRYSYAAMGNGPVRTLKALWEGGASISEVDRIVETVFDEVLEPLYAAARYDRIPLIEYWAFRRFAADVRPRVAALADPDAPLRQGDYVVPNVVRFYEQVLPTLPDTPGEEHYVCTAHGDLNTANILVDARGNVWVIDFFHTAPGHHVLRDLAKLENDVLYVLTPVADEAALDEALLLTRALRKVVDLSAELPESVAGVTRPELLRAWAVIRTLRRIGGKLVREDRHPLQLSLALLRYAVHTLGFDESSPLQRRWALLAAAGHAEDIERTLLHDRRLRLDWLEALPSGALGMTICPGRRDRGRDLTTDLRVIREAGVTRLVCLLPDFELEDLGVPDLCQRAEAAGIHVLHVPIRDQGVPTVAEAREIVDWTNAALEAGERLVVHCMGGLGRTGTIAACVLVARGLGPREAIGAVRRSRGPRAVENLLQEGFVERFARA